MALKVVGAGLGRTGTHSLKLALERLLGEPCYHMVEVFNHPQHVSAWHGAAVGNGPDWGEFMDGYGAAVDWPASAFWPELNEAFPNALILLSIRDPEAWWNSAHETIFASTAEVGESRGGEWFEMIQALFRTRFTVDIHDRDACIEAYKRHNDNVIRTANPERLLVWQASDGWEPICSHLGLPVPEEPFPRSNTKEEFLARRKQEIPT